MCACYFKRCDHLWLGVYLVGHAGTKIERTHNLRWFSSWDGGIGQFSWAVFCRKSNHHASVKALLVQHAPFYKCEQFPCIVCTEWCEIHTWTVANEHWTWFLGRFFAFELRYFCGVFYFLLLVAPRPYLILLVKILPRRAESPSAS